MKAFRIVGSAEEELFGDETDRAVEFENQRDDRILDTIIEDDNLEIIFFGPVERSFNERERIGKMISFITEK